MASSIAKAYVQIIPSAEGVKDNLSGVFDKEMPSAGQDAGGIFGSNLVSRIKSIIAAAGIGKMLTESLMAGADLQQSLGGVETLFKDSADIVIANAEQAYKTAGMSANAYMETVTGFSASLLQGLGGDTEKAASIADMALTDMADNANKMGTSMESIQNAYQGFAKQNYTMLDNLKLGYGGTKTEMERLLADAQKLTGVEYDISNLADVYSAIHAIQGELGITGTTALEASETISGSLSSMKAAFSDVLANLALGRDLEPSLNALAETAVTFLTGNLIPAIWNIISALPGALVTFVNALIPENMQEIVSNGISQLSSFMSDSLPVILENGKQAITEFSYGFQSGFPDFLSSAADLLGQLLESVISALPEILSSGAEIIGHMLSGFLQGVPDFLSTAGELLNQLLDSVLSALPDMLASGVSLIGQLAEGLINNLPAVIQSAASILAKLLATIASHLPDLLEQGIALIGKLAAGLIAAIPDLIASIPTIISGICDTFGQWNWGEIAYNIDSGIAKGITAYAGAIWDAAKQAARSALTAAKQALGIASPSKVMRDEVGKFIPSGLAVGIEANTKPLTDAMHDLSDLTTGTLQTDLRLNGSLYQIASVPVVASTKIRGTNEDSVSYIEELLEDLTASNLAGHEASVAVLRKILEAILGIELDGTAITHIVDTSKAKNAVCVGGAL